MSSIPLTLINSSNSSFILPIGKYTDFNIWIIIFIFAMIFIIGSRFLSSREESGRLIIAVIGLVLMIVTLYGSLGLAHVSYATGATIAVTNTTDQVYVYPVITPLAAPWLTAVCVVLLILAFLNALDIFLALMQKPEVTDMKKKEGRGVRL